MEADLDQGFPELAGPLVDLVWASSSLHHVAHPARLLEGVRGALAPGGVLAVVELATLPLFLGDGLGDGLGDERAALLEQRCHAAAAAEGWNRYADWTPVIEAAGFGVIRSEVTTNAPVTPAAREYFKQWFGRFLHLESLSANDRAAVEALLEQDSNGLYLEPRVTRTVWVAHPSGCQNPS